MLQSLFHLDFILVLYFILKLSVDNLTQCKGELEILKIQEILNMRGEVSDLPEGLTEGLSAEKQQEQQLMNKLAASGKLPARPASSFLQKKLQQRKFFDSGDYAMDKDRCKQTRGPHPMAAPAAATKASVPVEPSSPETDGSLQIPRPDTVPQRKASIINPSVHCKLSPLPHVQHHDGQPQLPSTE